MNEPIRLPSRRQLSRPSAELGLRMDALFANASVAPAAVRPVHRPWWWLLAPAGLAGAAALIVFLPWRAARRAPAPGPCAVIILPADRAATLLVPTKTVTAYSLSVRSY